MARISVGGRSRTEPKDRSMRALPTYVPAFRAWKRSSFCRPRRGGPMSISLVEDSTAQTAAQRTGYVKWKCTMSIWDLATRRWTGRMSMSPGTCRYYSPPLPSEWLHPLSDGRLWRGLPDADRWTGRSLWLPGEPQDQPSPRQRLDPVAGSCIVEQ